MNEYVADPRARELLEWPFDFALVEPGSRSWFLLANNQPFEVIAKDGSGNVFALLGPKERGPTRPLLYVCHAGQAGVIAKDLLEALGMFVSAPYWRDLLKFSGGGDPAHMRRAVPHLEQEMLEDEPRMEAMREELQSRLAIERLSDPVAVLHDNVRASEASVIVTSDDGEPFESLFNTFVPEDNPMWTPCA